jgi:hypothetical protein
MDLERTGSATGGGSVTGDVLPADRDVLQAALTLACMRREGETPACSKMCAICGATSTPAWRRSVKHDVLCNRCGIRERTALRALRDSEQ